MHYAICSPRPPSLRFSPLTLPPWCYLSTPVCCELSLWICSVNLSPRHWSPISKGQVTNSLRWVATLTLWFSTEVILPPGVYLTVCDDFLAIIPGGQMLPASWTEARDVAIHPTMHSPGAHTASTAPRLRNLGLTWSQFPGFLLVSTFPVELSLHDPICSFFWTSLGRLALTPCTALHCSSEFMCRELIFLTEFEVSWQKGSYLLPVMPLTVYPTQSSALSIYSVHSR